MGPAAAKLGLDLLIGLGGNSVAKAQIRAQNTINAANVYASNLMRGANNELAAKRGSLARYTQSVNNQRVMDDTGSAMEANLVNYQRARDGTLRDDLEQQIGFAEQQGQQEAAAAASGLSGGVSDVVAGTLALRKSRIQGANAATSKAAAFDAGRAQANTLAAGLSALDNSDIVTDIDYSVDTFVAQRGPSVAGVLLQAGANYLGNLPGKTSKDKTPDKASFSFKRAIGSFFGVP